MLEKIINFFKKNYLLKHLLMMFLFVVIVLFTVLLWLRIYTNHGQKIEMPDFSELELKDAKKIANKSSFSLVVNDSIHNVGMKGGIVLSQNPEPGSMVKEGRTVYVTVTKYNADKIKISELPVLYGVDYEQKKTELSYRNIGCKIKGRKYDPGEPNYILEVWYDGDLIISRDVLKSDVQINKGDVLEFVISESGGGTFLIPSLTCNTLGAAEFLVESSRLTIGDVREIGTVTDRNTAYIVSQDPPYDGESKIGEGSSINLTISQEKPKNCD